MEIQGNDRYKIEKILRNIRDGQFDEITIDSLLIGLRPYSRNAPALRDIADMVAHPEERNKGPANTYINIFYRHWRFLQEYTFPKRPLDFAGLPIYVKKILIKKIESAPAADIEKRYKESQKTIISRLNNLFIEDKKTGTAKLKGKLTNPTFELVKELLSTLSGMPAYDQHDVIHGLLKILDAQGLSEYASAIESGSDKITACILALFHKRTHTLEDADDGFEANCEIATENGGYPIGVTYVDENDQPVQIDKALGKLHVLCGFPVKRGDGSMGTISFVVFKSDLEAEEWCDASLASIKPPLSGPAHMLWFSLDFDRAVGISRDFKLTAL
ncbi:hypothetical protein [Pseudomonas sp. NPDC090201]|uniref:hypothetical protein n=1 Tax=Pseudomonas sp. NPDC090201 TaxID=3364475 RepID=UPI0037FCD4E1